MKKKNKMKKTFASVLWFLFSVALGAVLGFVIAASAQQHPLSENLFLNAALLLLALYGALLVQTILHEAGHLLFGLLSGYRFSSFRIFRWLIQRGEDGRLHLRSLHLPGTAGQCLMLPPQPVDGKIPTALYNLGGVAMNLILGLPCLLLAPAVESPPARLLLFALGLMGVVSALLNGIPMNAAVPNDGYNALHLGRDPEAVRCFAAQLAVAERLSRGKRLGELPEEWFTLPSEQGLRNPLCASVAALSCGRLMDTHRFEEARQRMEQLLDAEGLLAVHRFGLVCDLVFLELIGQNRPEVLESLWDKEAQRLAKQLVTYPDVIRTQYARAVLQLGDEKQAERALAMFEKAANRHPYSGEVELNRELMAMVQR